MRGARALALLLATAPATAAAHGFQPARLELQDLGGGRYASVWAVPLGGEGGEDGREPLELLLPARCRSVGPSTQELVDLRSVHRDVIACGPRGLRGSTLAVVGLDVARVDAFVVLRDASTFTAVLRPDAPSVDIPEGAVGWRPVAWRYAALGVHHILSGADHLLFVLGLVLLVGAGSVRRLVSVVTAFTVAHSVTLALTTLGLVRVAQAPAEACIALSIAALARSLVKGGSAPSRAVTMAAGFGLLHGFGFAGALAEVGLPERAFALALGAFNVGVELGQLAFVALLLAAGAVAARAVRPAWRARARTAIPWAMGAVSMYWFVQRTIA